MCRGLSAVWRLQSGAAAPTVWPTLLVRSCDTSPVLGHKVMLVYLRLVWHVPVYHLLVYCRLVCHVLVQFCVLYAVYRVKFIYQYTLYHAQNRAEMCTIPQHCAGLGG